jgi:ubiquinone/menaquinone biosynthesis C-methylase UbiE
MTEKTVFALYENVKRGFMKNPFDCLFVRERHVCPWWLCFTFDNLIRKLLHNPENILGPYVHEGNTVLDIGPGMGYFSIPLARMVGDGGRVIAADVQAPMLAALRKRARKAGVEGRIVPHLCEAESIDVSEPIDLALAFWMVHEVPNQTKLFHEIRSLLKPEGKFLLAEPTIHVTRARFEETLKRAGEAGFAVTGHPKIFMSRTALLSLREGSAG